MLRPRRRNQAVCLAIRSALPFALALPITAAAQAAPSLVSEQIAVGAPVQTLMLEPQATSLQLRESRQFSTKARTAAVPTDLVWEVNGVAGGAADTGRISAAGLYTAPLALPVHHTVTVTARSLSQPGQATSTIVNLASGLTSYVATTGSDANPGTLALPWRTIQHAANSVQAGDIVNVRAGVYKEAVTIGRSGTSSAGPITFESYPGETAIVDGTGLRVLNGQSGLFNIRDQNYIIISGFEVRNFTTASTSDAPVGIYLSGADAYVQLLNNHVHNITTTAPANSVNCASNALAIAVYGTSAPAAIDHLTVSGNEIDHNKTGCSENLSLNGNVTNFTVTNNLIHDNNNIGIDVIGFEGKTQAAYDQARNGVISGNTVYNISSYGNPDYGNNYSADGIYVDGGTNVLIERNTVHNADLNVELASEHRGKLTSYVTLRSNLIYNGNSNGISIGGYDNARGGSDHCTIVNNTLYNNDTKQTGSGEFQVQWYATNNLFKNNIVSAGSQDLIVNNYTASESHPVDMDDNLYFSSDAANSTWIWNGKTYTGFAAYQSATAEDPHSSFRDPLFLSTTTPNFRVAATSPAVNHGVNLGAAVVGTLDLAGKPRVQGTNIDIGAYEQ